MTTVLIVSSDGSLEPGIPGNLGDAFLTEALAQALRECDLIPVIADFGNPTTVPGGMRISMAGSRTRLLSRAIRSADLVLVGGGTLLQGNALNQPVVGGLPLRMLATSMLARVHRTPLAFFGVGANPVVRLPQRLMLRAALLGRKVWARDQWTRQLLRDAYGKPSEVAADAAMLAYRVGAESNPDGGPLVLAGYPGDVESLTPAIIEQLRAKFGAVHFISMNQGSDGDSTYLAPAVRNELDAVHENLSVDQGVAVIRAASAVGSSRMHALYLGLLAGRPLAALGNRHKVRSFRDEFSVPALTEWTDLLSVDPVTADLERSRAAAARARSALDTATRATRSRATVST